MELQRRLQLADELSEKAEALTKSETELQQSVAAQTASQMELKRSIAARTDAEKKLRESVAARTSAEMAASDVAKEQDRIRQVSDWLKYTESLVEADRHLTKNEKGAANDVLGKCSKSLRGWEWFYLYDLSTGVSPKADVLADPNLLLSSVEISDDAANFVVATNKSGPLKVYQAAPIVALHNIGSGNNTMDVFRLQRALDDPSHVTVLGSTYNWELDAGRITRTLREDE